MTQSLVDFLGSFGYLTVLVAGFAEYAGVPIATVPVLIAAGGLSESAGLNPFLVAASAASGGLAAAALLVVGGAVWRGVRVGVHRDGHDAHLPEEKSP